jgi:hypothetical protein
MEKTIRIFTDPGHGWAAVPFDELKELNIDHLITSYSYIKGDMVFLEEDYDFGIYMNKLKELHPDMTFKIRETHDDNSPIRNYRQYLFGVGAN